MVIIAIFKLSIIDLVGRPLLTNTLERIKFLIGMLAIFKYHSKDQKYHSGVLANIRETPPSKSMTLNSKIMNYDLNSIKNLH